MSTELFKIIIAMCTFAGVALMFFSAALFGVLIYNVIACAISKAISKPKERKSAP